MSFSSKVKEELRVHFGNARHCLIAEVAAILNMCGDIRFFGEKFCVKVQTENEVIATKYFTLLEKTFNIRSEVSVRIGGKERKSKTYLLMVCDPKEAEDLLTATGLLISDDGNKGIENRIYSSVVSSICCRRAYLRGAFLSSGSVSDPEKYYHLEFVTDDNAYGEALMNLLNSFQLDAKMVERKDHFVIYLKEGERIVDLLNIMEAHRALMDLENVRIFKDMRNNVNRKVNCETANLNKTVSAAVKQLEEIQLIDRFMGISTLSEPLADMARARMEYPDASLKELGENMAPPVGKSGVHHRLRKISEIAETIREGKGDFV